MLYGLKGLQDFLSGLSIKKLKGKKLPDLSHSFKDPVQKALF